MLTILLEAFVIGLMNVFVIAGLEKLRWRRWIMYFVSGALIHLFFEIIGGNKWWCVSTYSIY
jgi:hypothetical protein